jgi:hypothetical protein
MRFACGVSSRRLLLLAPTRGAVPEHFTQIQSDPRGYENLLEKVQHFRGRVYLEDGAIKPAQLSDGRHCLETDRTSWHLLVLDLAGQICGCARFKQYPAGAAYSDLTVSRSALAQSGNWGGMLRGAVEAEMALARRRNCRPSEWGGWALDEEVRGTAEALRMTLAAYALSCELGGGVALSCATRRHGSASILRRMGGRSLKCQGVEMPAYYDPQYECEMEILSFHSWEPNPRYGVWIEEIRSTLCHTPVLTVGAADSSWRAERGSQGVLAVAGAAAAG